MTQAKIKMQAMISTVYFGQTDFYFSASKEAALSIAAMHRVHAANAAEKLLTDARTWALEAGIAGADKLDGNGPARMWMLSTPLHRALVNRAVGAR